MKLLMSLMIASVLTSSMALAAAPAADQNLNQFFGKFAVDEKKCTYVNYESEYVRAYVSKEKNRSEINIMLYGDEAMLFSLESGRDVFDVQQGTSPTSTKTVIKQGTVRGNRLTMTETYILNNGQKKLSGVVTLTNLGQRLVYEEKYNSDGDIQEARCEFVRVRR
ncbi:MAG: hypothetical protein NDI61_05820 [Bdellovibrionaceae bacterium]|nr:hypothetical protein [Pseudobdellovibrionaceae bacterium]